MQFHRLIMADWSAASAPGPRRPHKDRCWVGRLDASEDMPELVYCRTRFAALAQIEAWTVEAASGAVLIGFDFPFGYPANCGLPGGRALCELLGGRIEETGLSRLGRQSGADGHERGRAAADPTLVCRGPSVAVRDGVGRMLGWHHHRGDLAEPVLSALAGGLSRCGAPDPRRSASRGNAAGVAGGRPERANQSDANRSRASCTGRADRRNCTRRLDRWRLTRFDIGGARRVPLGFDASSEMHQIKAIRI